MNTKKIIALISCLMAVAVFCTVVFSSPEIKALDEFEGTEDSATVTYYGNGGLTGENLDSFVSDSLTVSENVFTRDTYMFLSWNTAPDGTGTTYNPGDVIPSSDGTVSLYAMWQEDCFKVYYDGNGGTTADGLTVVDSGEFEAGTKVVFAENPFQREGYKFVNWNTRADGSGQAGKVNQKFLMPSRNMTFYAIWEASSDEPVTDSEVNTESAVDTESETDSNMSDTETSTDSEQTTDTSSTTDTTDTTDTSSDIPAPVQKHKVTYVTSEETVIDGGSFKEGENFKLIDFTGDAPKGQSFSHWSENESGEGTQYRSGETLRMGNKDITLYAVYVNNSYNVVYVSNYGDNNEEIIAGSFEYLSVITAKENTFKREGYTFVCWNTLSDGTGTDIMVGDRFYMPATNARLYAKWVKNSQTTTGGSSYSGNVKTGSDNTAIYVSAALLAGALVVMAVCMIRRKKNTME